MKRMQAGAAGMMTLGKNKAKLVGENDIETRFIDVAGADEAKDELTEIVSFLTEPQRYQDLGGRMPKGILLVGPAGNRKDSVGPCGGRRGRRSLFCHQWFGFR